MRNDELFRLLQSVPGTYDDFISFMINAAREDRLEDVFIDYIKAHPDDTSSDILEYMYDNGILKTGDLTLGEDE